MRLCYYGISVLSTTFSYFYTFFSYIFRYMLYNGIAKEVLGMTKNDNEIRKNIQNNLMELRKLHHLTQADISKLTGKAVTTVATWEQGKTLPDAYTLYRLAKRYNVSMDYMYQDNSGVSFRIDIPDARFIFENKTPPEGN